MLLAGEQRFVRSYETKGKHKSWEKCKTTRVMTSDEHSSYRPNEAWFTGVLSLLLLVIMRVRLLGHSALITLIRNQRRERQREKESRERSFSLYAVAWGYMFSGYRTP